MRCVRIFKVSVEKVIHTYIKCNNKVMSYIKRNNKVMCLLLVAVPLYDCALLHFMVDSGLELGMLPFQQGVLSQN